MKNKQGQFTLREFAFSSPEYKESVRLRQRVLRDPLMLRFTEKDLEPDCNDLHLGAFEGAVLVASLILTRQSARLFKMRQVAVEPCRQGCGIGMSLVRFAEQIVAGLGGEEITLNARQSAVLFYEKAGYVVFGEPTLAVTLPHRYMRKTL
jgi:ribosomal protein S18 acetylase RimI-like enzyme